MGEPEIAWVIEHNAIPLCFGKVCGGKALAWVTFTDHDALRFHTKEDADNFIRHHALAHTARATEHRWG